MALVSLTRLVVAVKFITEESLVRMVRVKLVVPSVVLVGLLRRKLTVSAPSGVVSLMMPTAKVLVVTPAAKVITPLVARKSVPARAVPLVRVA